MEVLILSFAAICLPLFPLSWFFNRVVASLPAGVAQALALIVLPQAGLDVLVLAPQPMEWPDSWRHYGMLWAIFTALFYSFRALSARDLGVWTRLLVTSGLALTWVGWLEGVRLATLHIFVLSWSLPAALLLLLAGVLIQRIGGAYLGLKGGLALMMPRMTASVTLSVLALAGTPIFPTFFVLLNYFWRLPIGIVPALLLLPFLWAWAVGRLFQNLLFGDYRGDVVADLEGGKAFFVGLALFASLFLSLYGKGVGL